MTFKNLRIKIFNWFASGKLTLTTNNTENQYMSTYSIGGAGGAGGYGGLSINPSYSSSIPQMMIPINLTIRISTANGGTVVSVNSNGEREKEELYIISDDADFDRELGKIITMNRLKA